MTAQRDFKGVWPAESVPDQGHQDVGEECVKWVAAETPLLFVCDTEKWACLCEQVQEQYSSEWSSRLKEPQQKYHNPVCVCVCVVHSIFIVLLSIGSAVLSLAGLTTNHTQKRWDGDLREPIRVKKQALILSILSATDTDTNSLIQSEAWGNLIY